MKNTLLILLAITGFQSSFAQTFNLDHPMGRVMVQKGGSERIYLGYFCVEMGNENGTPICLKSQFGKGRDLFLGVSFLGNPTTALGTWQAIGPVFDEETGNAFYMKTLEGEKSEKFTDIWKAVWSREGFNWSENPVEIRKSKMEEFLSLLTDGSVDETKKFIRKIRIKRKRIIRSNGVARIEMPRVFVPKQGFLPFVVGPIEGEKICKIFGFKHYVSYDIESFPELRSGRVARLGDPSSFPDWLVENFYMNSVTCY